MTIGSGIREKIYHCIGETLYVKLEQILKYMEENNLDQLIDSINRLQVVLDKTQREISELKQKVEQQQRPERTSQRKLNGDQILYVGDTVVITNSV